MAKRETKETYKQTKDYGADVSAQYDPLVKESQERAAGIGGTLGGQREQLEGGLRKMMEDPRDIVARQISAQNVGFNKIADPRATNVGDLRNSLDYYKTFRDTGGLSSENVERMRGMGGFDEFAKTGGYTDKSLANIKAQAISPISSYATGTRDELDRRRAVQGGYAPGFDAANRSLQRDTARAIADTSLNANVMLQDRVNQGRQWGIGGLAQAEGQLAGLQTGNKLAAAAGEAGISKSLADLDAADIDRLMQTGMFNSRGELDAAIANQQASLQADQFNAQSAMSADRFNLENEQSQYAQGLSGLGGLYNQDVGIQQGEYDRQLAIQDAANRARSGYLSTQGGLSTQPGIGGNLINAGGSAAGIASDYFKKKAIGSAIGAGTTGGAATGVGTGTATGASSSAITGGTYGASGLSGTTGGGIAGGAGGGGTSALGMAGYAALPAGAAALAYGFGEKGWGRGGTEGAYVNPSRNNLMGNFDKYEGNTEYERMVNGLASNGVVGPQAEQLISELYNAKTPAQYQAIQQKMYPAIGQSAAPARRATIEEMRAAGYRV